MAEEEKTTVEVGEGEGAPEGGAKKGGNKLILFGGIGAGVIVLGVVLTLFVLKPMMSGDSAEEPAAEEQKQEQAAEKPAEPKKPKKAASHGAAKSVVYSVKDIIVNPAGTGGTRFLSVSFGFQLASAQTAAQFEERDMLVRDALITILASKTVAQLTDARQKEIVRLQIKKRLEQLLDTDEIEGVYYTDFVLQ
jgi:flagellar FliL protein